MAPAQSVWGGELCWHTASAQSHRLCFPEYPSKRVYRETSTRGEAVCSPGCCVGLCKQISTGPHSQTLRDWRWKDSDALKSGSVARAGLCRIKKNQLLGSWSVVRAVRSLQEARKCSLGYVGIAFVCGSRALWLFGGWHV